ncbi:hypothetical protein GCM10007160_20970 [Litchfieldella qijiaojingensis]|uniref:Glyoxalase/fosfomycin resistance/dioxygenase domain-containing protein n=1 Tax=Litchfieldella qijiaojingensis TaxID=980347 RepID=A0ABQ2YRW0_9GAMM|nr:VOC family protein [Halomonas qijiaojingensis]GGX93243.1 hypothetical protein GCM10007160_20970 [Halomonas qijiaojingensis]
MTSLDLVVVRVSDVEQSKLFYEALGLRFKKEKHGNGPLHYSSKIGDVVFEIYPASGENPVSAGTRLGFSTVVREDLDSTIMSLGGQVISRSDSGIVVADPDGIKIEINSRVAS